MARPYSKKSGSFHSRGGGGGGNNNNNGGRGGGNNNNNNNNNGGGFGGRGGGGGRGRGRFNNRHGGNHNNNNNNANKNNNGNNNNNSGGGANADVMKALLSLLFEKSYNVIFTEANGFLNMSNMRSHPDLESVQKRVDFNSVQFCNALADVLREKFANRIRLVQLDDNNITNFKLILTALADADIHRGITAVSAAKNSVNDYNFIGALRRYDGLNELLLRDNPVVNRSDYTAQVIRQLPRLNMLDGVAVDRALLSMPNPLLTTNLNNDQLYVLRYLEQTLFTSMTTSDFNTVLSLYNPQFSALSVSRGMDPLPPRVPIGATTNTGDLEKTMRNQMQADLSKMRSAMDFRNLATDSVGTMRNVAKGPQDIVKKLRAICGDGRSMQVEVEFNPNSNVVFMDQSYHVPVPVCVLTVHGKMRYRWNPIHADTQQPTFAPNRAPYISTFFDRTMTMMWDGNTNTWSIGNDMLLMRPDRTVVHDDGTPSCPLFFANTVSRMEQMRRRLMPDLSPEVMALIVNNTLSDEGVKASVQRLLQLPPDQLATVATNVEAAKQTLGF